MRGCGRWTLLSAVVLALVCARANAQSGVVEPTREDMARAYLRFDRALASADDAAMARVSLPFDRATTQFFRGRGAEALRTLTLLTAELRGEDASTSTRSLLEAYRIDADPDTVEAGFLGPIRVTVTPLHALDGWTGRTIGARLELVNAEGDAKGVHAFALRGVESSEIVLGPLSFDQPGSWSFRVSTEGAPWSIDAPGVAVLDEPMGRLVERLEARLNRNGASAMELRDAISGIGARLTLLTDRPTPFVTARALVEPVTLLAEIEREVASIADGADPFARRFGDVWRALDHRGGQLALRTYAPEAVVRSGDPAPLLFALHGAGADEHMWLSGFNAGMLKRLADEHGFIVVSPSTYPLLASPEGFDRVLASVREQYPIDPERVALIGHSLGGITASALAQVRAEQIDAACCIAGARWFAPNAPTAPTLIYVAGRDPIVPAPPLREIAAEAREVGLPVELREREQLGHTVIVNAVLDEAVAWIVKQWEN